MLTRIKIKEFLERSGIIPIIDVRAPIEFKKGHIPGAINLPLFDDDERVEVGTLYRQKGREDAVVRAYEIIVPKLNKYKDKIKEISYDSKILVHCWRGGMRSEGMATFANALGFDAFVLDGGYKAYRKFIREEFLRPSNIVILSGMTGSGKTDILCSMQQQGEQVIDLEGIANHRGSAFGSLGQEEQPSNEQFENNIFDIWKDFDLSKTIWIEDESRKVGKVVINEPLYEQMRNAPVVKINVAKSHRIGYLIEGYADFDQDILIESVTKIEKRFGLENTKKTVEYIRAKDYHSAIAHILNYYDKGYGFGIKKRPIEKIHEIDLGEINPEKNSKAVLEFLNNNYDNILK